jgi:hypothetical protein
MPLMLKETIFIVRIQRKYKSSATHVATAYYGIKNFYIAKPTFSYISSEYVFGVYEEAVDNFFYRFRVRLCLDVLQNDS